MKTGEEAKLFAQALGEMARQGYTRFYTPGEIEQILANAQREYEAILLRTPEMGGRANPYIDNLYVGAYLIALYKEVREKIGIEPFGQILLASLQSKGTPENAIDPAGEAARQVKLRAAEWGRQHREQYPWTWQLEVKDGVKDGGLYFEYSNCGLHNLCKAEGVPQLTRVMCDTDFFTFGVCGRELVRTKTLAAGDDCCDFWVRSKA